MMYNVRFVHKIAPSDKDTGSRISLSEMALTDRKTLGAALRKAKVLIKGGAIQQWRIETGGRVVVFPSAPGMTTYWHSIILSPIGDLEETASKKLAQG